MLVQIVLCWGYRRGVTVQLRFLAWPAMLCYVLDSYTSVRFAHAKDSSLPCHGASLATIRCVQAALVTFIAGAETLR